MSGSGKYCGVLLAAGKGSRMGAFSSQIPKPMLPVGNKPLLVHQIELLRRVGITDIIVLIGHKGFEIARVLGDGRQYGVNLTYVEQTETLGIAHAVGQLESSVDKPFLLLLGDIFFIEKNMEKMLEKFEQQGGGAVLATKIEEDPLALRRNYSVQVDPGGRVVRVVEKPRHVTNKLKGVGLYLFDLTIFDAIRRTPRTAMRDEYEITDAIQVLINDGEYVSTCDAVHDDVNVTFPVDLLRVNIEFARNCANGNLISETAEIDPRAQLANSVIGHGARIASGVTMNNCLVFDNACVGVAGRYENVIVTRDKLVSCHEPTEGG